MRTAGERVSMPGGGVPASTAAGERAILPASSGNCQHAREAIMGGCPPSLRRKPAGVRGFVFTAESGQPLAGAQVILRGGTPQKSFLAVTNADGRYEISGVPPGVYVAVFSKPTFVTLHYGQAHSFASR